MGDDELLELQNRLDLVEGAWKRFYLGTPDSMRDRIKEAFFQLDLVNLRLLDDPRPPGVKRVELPLLISPAARTISKAVDEAVEYGYYIFAIEIARTWQGQSKLFQAANRDPTRTAARPGSSLHEILLSNGEIGARAIDIGVWVWENGERKQLNMGGLDKNHIIIQILKKHGWERTYHSPYHFEYKGSLD